MKKALIIGFGSSGRAAAKFLQAKGYVVCCLDERPVENFLSVEIFDSMKQIPNWDFEFAVLSPGFSLKHPYVVMCKKRGIAVIGEMELGARFVHQPCIGITGTNGKTTCCSLLAHVLSDHGVAAKAVGNIGIPLTEYLLNPQENELLIVEISSFQLETMSTPFLDFAMILNITPDHLDRHGSYLEYGKIKCKIGSLLKSSGVLFVTEDVRQLFYQYIRDNQIQLITNENFDSELGYFPMNLSAVFLLCKNYGISLDCFTNSFRTFTPPGHRLQFVRKVNDVAFFNDSKATNIHSVMAAVDYLKKDVWLLAGGVDKKGSYEPWIESFRGKVRGIVAFGQVAPMIYRTLANHCPVFIMEDLPKAVKKSFEQARPGEKILLSPGSSSFDQFENYKHRGEVFQKEVERLT